MIESFVSSKSTTGLFVYFLKKEKVKLIGLGLICVIRGIIPSIDGILLQQIIDLLESFSNDQIKNLPSSMLFWAGMYAMWWMGVNIMWRTFDYLYLKTMPYIKGYIIEEMYNYTQYHSHKFFQEYFAGQITNIIMEGTKDFEMVLYSFGDNVIYKLAIIIFAFITMYSVHPIFAIIFISYICIFFGIGFIFLNTISTLSLRYAKSKSIIAGNVLDSIININVIRMFTSHKFERQHLRRKINNTIVDEQNLNMFMFKLRFVLGLIASCMIFAMIYYMSILRTQITIGDCVLVLNLCLTVSSEIWDLVQEVGDMLEDYGSFNQMILLLKPYVIQDIENAPTLQVTKGEISFKNVTFKYQRNNNLFENKSVTILSNQKIGLVGCSGSGKTTFVNLITRLYDIDKGEILIDDQNIRYITQDSLRTNISIIPQDPILFHRTIIDNLRYGKKDASLEEVIQAAKVAHIHEFITSLPEGYESLCGERGNNLSGGQRQRIIIARAILKNAPILILDEATSSLDSKTEELIQDSLNYLMKNKTVLVIAHRLSTLLNMDRILVFSEGSVVEDGQHEQLLKTSELYKKLWYSQMKGILL